MYLFAVCHPHVKITPRLDHWSPKEDETSEAELGHPSPPSQDHPRSAHSQRTPNQGQHSPPANQPPQKCGQYLLCTTDSAALLWQ